MTTAPKETDIAQRAIKGFVIREVERKLLEEILPNVNKIVHDAALEAVAAWSTRMYTEYNMEHSKTNTMVTFVENVIKEVVNKIEITEVKDKQ